MSFTLFDLGSENYQFTASVWNWKALLEVIKSLDVVSEGKLRQMSYNATGVKIAAEDAQMIGEALAAKILPQLQPNKRIYADLSITDEPDDMTLHKDQDEQWKNYSIGYDQVREFAEFCSRSKGFQVF